MGEINYIDSIYDKLEQNKYNYEDILISEHFDFYTAILTVADSLASTEFYTVSNDPHFITPRYYNYETRKSDIKFWRKVLDCDSLK